MLTERQTWLPMLGQSESDAELLATFDVDDMPTEALLFQTGYLTIDRKELLGSAYFYRLRFPNHKVYPSTAQDGSSSCAVCPPDGLAALKTPGTP